MHPIVLIFGMMVVTMIPRILPFYAFDPDKVPKAIRIFLNNIPYCVLGALILPGGLTGIAGNPGVSLLCLLAAAGISWKKGGIIYPIIGAVLLAIILI